MEGFRSEGITTDPKSGASANFATLAWLLAIDPARILAHTAPRRQTLKTKAILRRCPSKTAIASIATTGSSNLALGRNLGRAALWLLREAVTTYALGLSNGHEL
jgi:hypothetical protein